MQLEYIKKLLGFVVEDVVTGFSGVISSISFDLYGCIQVLVTPKMDKDGKLPDSRWFDVNRVNLKSSRPVMECPLFSSVKDISERELVEKGPAEKPIF